MDTASLATVDRRAVVCLFCSGRLFFSRPIKLNTTGFEFFDVAWANRSSVGLICTECGFIHEFLNDNVEMWDPAAGYPDGTTEPAA